MQNVTIETVLLDRIERIEKTYDVDFSEMLTDIQIKISEIE